MKRDPRRLASAIGWPFRKLLVAVITVYRTMISPMMGPRCKYHPSCSAYALGAVQGHGAAKGSALATWRLLRCNPFSKGGFDPVPAHGRWRPDVHPDGRPRHPGEARSQRPAESASKEA